jgi:hypothetical protein
MNKDKLDLFFDLDKLRDIPAYPNLVWDELSVITPEMWEYLRRRTMKYIILRTEDDNWIVGEFELNVEGIYVYKQGLLYHTLTQATDSIKLKEKSNA